MFIALLRQHQLKGVLQRGQCASNAFLGSVDKPLKPLAAAELPVYRVAMVLILFYTLPAVSEHHQHELPETFPGSQVDQAPKTGLHHPYPPLDLCTVF